jgi:MFS family permease
MFSKRLILIIVAMVMFMESVDTTVINTSIPIMAQSLHANPLDLKLALISYLLSLAIFIPISGWFADKYGPNKVFLIAVTIFTLSSVACGSSTNLSHLIVFRLIQGLGSSMSIPVARLILLRNFKRNELISNLAFVITISSLGNMLGPLLGGFISTHFSWRWIFWVNAPFGFITIYLAHKFLPKMAKHKVPKLDKIGFLLFGIGLASLTFGLSCLSEQHLPIKTALITILGAILLLIMYFRRSKHQKHPIVHLELFQYSTFKISLINNFLFRIIMGGLPFILPLMLQINLGFSPQMAGLYMAPIALGVIFMKALDRFFLKKFGHKNILIYNTFITSFVLASFAFITPALPHYLIAILTFSYGFFLSLQYVSLNSLCYADIEEIELSKATSIVSTVQQVGISFGVASAAFILRVVSGHFHSEGVIKLHHFQECYIMLALFGLLLIFNLKKLSDKDGQHLI